MIDGGVQCNHRLDLRVTESKVKINRKTYNKVGHFQIFLPQIQNVYDVSVVR